MQTDLDSLQESKILHHCRSLKRNSTLKVLLVSSHLSLSSITPLSSTSHLPHCLPQSLLPLIHPRFSQTNLLQNSWSERKNSVLAIVSKDRGGMKWRGFNSYSLSPGQAPYNLWCSFFMFSALLVSLWVISTLFPSFTIQLWPCVMQCHRMVSFTVLKPL